MVILVEINLMNDMRGGNPFTFSLSTTVMEYNSKKINMKRDADLNFELYI